MQREIQGDFIVMSLLYQYCEDFINSFDTIAQMSLSNKYVDFLNIQLTVSKLLPRKKVLLWIDFEQNVIVLSLLYKFCKDLIDSFENYQSIR